MSKQKIFQYVQLKSLVQPDFWHKLAEIKLNVEMLSENNREVCGVFTNLNARSCLIEFDAAAFNSDFTTAKSNVFCRGTLLNLNTVESFKNCDKRELLIAAGKKLMRDIEDGSVLEDPSKLVSFLLLAYADLKKFNFFYWFAFVACIDVVAYEASASQSISDVFGNEEIEALRVDYEALPQQQAIFFILTENRRILLLKDAISTESDKLKDFDLNTAYFCFADPSEYEQPAWILRNFILCLVKLCPSVLGRRLKVLAIRRNQRGELTPSRVFFIEIPPKIDLTSPNWTGWERDDENRQLPKVARMADSMNPLRIAAHFSTLNLKLMKWRLLPDLDLDVLKRQRCLLFGAGTLGCAIARSLLSWGIDTITLVDCGRVSHSNPVRQSLFTHRDALEHKFKATAAAERLKEVLPSADVCGHVLQIPMPGHQTDESTIGDLEAILTLVEEHDVLFLLTDSRESRWLPTVLGARSGKTVITAALGFDTYLIMRHGGNRKNAKDFPKVEGLKCIGGAQLGCYFCNDITAPGNSSRSRTLDQQCTVTRPGVSNIAAAIAVELLVSLCQHEDGNCAPAYYQATAKGKESVEIPEGILGVVPHSIRGYLSTFTQILPATERFSQCIACSEKVLEAFESEGLDFLLRVFESVEYLEKVTGIDEMANVEEHAIMEDFDSDS